MLNVQADCIEAVLLARSLSCRVTGGVVSPRYVRFAVLLGAGARCVQVEVLADDLALHLGVPPVRIGRAGNVVTVEIERGTTANVPLLLAGMA